MCNLQLGTFNPLPFKDGVKEITLDSIRVKYWLSVGAQPSERVAWLLGKVDILPPAPIRNSLSHVIPKALREKKA